ncbi:MAG: hypothetical protein RLZZ422_101 [Pseudomonadota bacterium]|jgi:uncharacterized protein (DUF1778 family)
MSLSVQRIDMRVNEQVKLLAERAANALGVTVTEYLVRLIQEDAPKVLEGNTSIVLTNTQFDRFVALCKQTIPPSPRILKAVQRLDNEGF